MKTCFTTRLAQTAVTAQNVRPILLGALALLGTVLAHPARAQQVPSVQMTQPDASSLRLRFDNPTRRPASLVVEDLTRAVALLNETHREPAYGTRLQFEALPTGRYLVTLRVGLNRYRYTVQVETPSPGATTIAVRETSTHRVESGLAVISAKR